MISVRFQGKPFTITIIQVYAPTSNDEEAEVKWFYEDLQDLLELTPQKDVLFIIGDCNAGDLGSIPGLGRSPEEGMATHSSTLAWRIYRCRRTHRFKDQLIEPFNFSFFSITGWG